MNLNKYLLKRAEKDAEVLITEADRLFSILLIQKIVESERQEKAEELSGNDTGSS